VSIYNLGIACGQPGDATNFYRAMGPFGPLRKMTKSLTISAIKELHWAVLKELDGVFMHRPFMSKHLELCNMIKAHKKPLWLDYDDNLFEVGLDNPTFQDYASTRTKETIVEMISMADIVTVTNPFLAQVYGRFTKNKVVVIPNALDDDILDVDAPLGPTKPIVFWRGGNTHAKDWSTVADDYVQVATSNPTWKYAFMGYQPWNVMEPIVKKLGNQSVIALGGCDIMRYFGAIKDLAPRIMVVPLFPGNFNASKSNIAWLEGIYAGAVVIAPDKLEEWDKPGVLRYDTGNFAAVFRAALEMPEEQRQDMREKGWHHIKSNLLLSVVNRGRRGVLERYMGL